MTVKLAERTGAGCLGILLDGRFVVRKFVASLQTCHLAYIHYVHNYTYQKYSLRVSWCIDGEGKALDSSTIPTPLANKGIIKEAIAFLTQFAEENNDAYSTSGGLEKRIEEMKREVEATGTYVQTFDELQYGCRLAWRNSGRCIMRKVCLYVHYLQCGFITTVLSFFFQLAPIGLFHPRVTG